jgi:N-acyl-D-amino-acid deacylase
MPCRRTFLRTAAAVGAGLALPCSTPADDLPVTGTAEPGLAPFDKMMTGFLTEHKVPGGALAVTRHGRLVYSRGFGHADTEKQLPVQPDALFRIASVSKPLTAVAVLRLVDAGKLRLDDPVLKHVRLKPHLEAGTEPDPRWGKVTVRHCLQHTGGWDRDRKGGFDPIGIPHRIAAALGTKPPVPPEDVVRYMMGRPLDFDPGTRFAYSNLGYLLLGRVVESASGEGYEDYVRQEVLAPLGITRPRLGRAMPEDRFKDEVRYYDASRGTGRCLYPPRAGERVPFPDGAANFEAYEAHGGWVASAADLVRFAAAFDNPKRCKVLSEAAIKTMWARPTGRAGFGANGEPRKAYYGCGWSVRPVGSGGAANTWHNGLISGTSALLVRRFDDLNWAVLFNTDRGSNGKVLSDLIDPLVHRAADDVREWPA